MEEGNRAKTSRGDFASARVVDGKLNYAPKVSWSKFLDVTFNFERCGANDDP
jgi:hypothetical protein